MSFLSKDEPGPVAVERPINDVDRDQLDVEDQQRYPRFSLLGAFAIILNIAMVLAAIRLGLDGTVRFEVAVALAYTAAILHWFVWHCVTTDWSMVEAIAVAVMGAILWAIAMPALN